MVASAAVTPSVASSTSRATSAASRCRRAITTLIFSAIRWVLPLRRMPAVSTNRSWLPSNSTTSSTASRVVPAMGETMARSVPVSAFSSVDLPTLGRPMMATEVSCCSNSPWVRWRDCASGGSSLPKLFGLLQRPGPHPLTAQSRPAPESPRQWHPAGRRCPAHARS